MDLKLTKDFIRGLVAGAHSPAVLSSFGKDSMVMLHLLREMKIELPVIYHRDPWFPAKNRFADAVAHLWNLVVHDWAPSACGIKLNATFETVARYQVGPNAYMDIPKNIVPPQHNERFVCGLRDVIERPKGSFLHPWDLYLHGHKSTDVDECDGPIPLRSDYVAANHGKPAVAFPLKDWTDADVWQYINHYRVPVQIERYNRETGELRPGHERTSNDYLTACVNCIDPRNPDEVHCPIRNGEFVPNISAGIARFQLEADYIKR